MARAKTSVNALNESEKRRKLKDHVEAYYGRLSQFSKLPPLSTFC